MTLSKTVKLIFVCSNIVRLFLCLATLISVFFLYDMNIKVNIVNLDLSCFFLRILKHFIYDDIKSINIKIQYTYAHNLNFSYLF